METRDDIMVSTHMRGAVIPTSSFKVFLAPNHRDVAYSSTLRGFNRENRGTVRIVGDLTN